MSCFIFLFFVCVPLLQTTSSIQTVKSDCCCIKQITSRLTYLHCVNLYCFLGSPRWITLVLVKGVFKWLCVPRLVWSASNVVLKMTLRNPNQTMQILNAPLYCDRRFGRRGRQHFTHCWLILKFNKMNIYSSNEYSITPPIVQVILMDSFDCL